ncbi:Ribosomal RNA large subunit methyltransferase E [Symbiodinium microadriaticum]|uniref:rRNA methyltransferase 2, mitochondrial n=1 Tax=Symbiodinium microadriaticum TaxID=2951 RepID=A0A1Q9DAH0_SYMMI|nr:Ribosomal RNA large subunit methyltransferase E [Symbiodinium microadriaticum]
MQAVLARKWIAQAETQHSDKCLKQEDHINSMQCSLYAAKIMDKTLRLGGWFVVRSMFGAEQDHWRTYLNSRFDTVRTIRPAASRSQFGEMFHICSGFIGRQSIASEVQVEGNDLSRYEGVEEWQGELQWLRGQGLLDETDYIPPKEDASKDPKI